MQRFRTLFTWAAIVVCSMLCIALFGVPAAGAATSPHARDWIGLSPLLIPIMGVTLGANMVTMADFAKMLGPDNKIAKVIELLSQTNSIVDDAVVEEGNTTTGWMGTVRTGLPAVVFRLVNQGVPPSKSTEAQLTEQAGRMEAWSEVDEALAELAPDLGAFRLQKASPFFESMNQTFASKLFYGNYGLAPEEFTGLAVRYSSTTAGNGGQIILAPAGTGGDNTSIWLVNWHPEAVTLIYPKGTQAGLQHNDLGLETVETTAGMAGNRMRAWRDQYIWRVGLAVKDWRSVVRTANIDRSDLIADQAGATVKIIELMARMIDRIQGPTGNLVFYTGRTVVSSLRVQAMNKSANALGVEQGLDQFGRARPGGTVTFLGIPVRKVDAILHTEAAVS